MITLVRTQRLLVLAGMSLAGAMLLAQAPAQAPSRIAQADAVVDAILAREFAKITSQFDDAMKGALPGDTLASGWAGTAAQVGKLVSRRPAVQQQRGASTVVVVGLQFEKASLDVTVSFNSSGQIDGLQIRPPAGVWTPPPYASAEKYTERAVTVGKGEWALPGTLALPVATGRVPALVLVHGSGPNDRDESVGPNKTFKDLAVGLASRGIAVLRYDKRSLVYGAKLAALKNPTVKDEVIDDVLEAVALLRANAAIDPDRIFVLGHSLGGMLIPRIGVADSKLAGLITLAGSVRPLEQLIAAQLQYLAEADGVITPAEQVALDDAKRALASLTNLTADDLKNSNKIANAPVSYWLDLRGYDPPAVAAKLPQRMLVLQGARDYQVTTVDYDRWKTGLSGKTNVEFHLYPALNHLFLPGVGKSLPAEYQVAGHVPGDVINDIATWMLR